MRKIFYVVPLLFLLAACSGHEDVEFIIKDKNKSGEEEDGPGRSV